MDPIGLNYQNWAQSNRLDEAWERFGKSFDASPPGSVGHYLAGNAISPQSYDKLHDGQMIERRFRKKMGDEMLSFALGMALIIVAAGGGSRCKAADIGDFLSERSDNDWEEFYEEAPNELYLPKAADWQEWVNIDVPRYYEEETFYEQSENHCKCDTNVTDTIGDTTEYAKAPPSKLPALPNGYWIIGRTRGIRIAANLVQASAPLVYAAGKEHESWHNTPYRTASAGHYSAEAVRMVKNWLRNKG